MRNFILILTILLSQVPELHAQSYANDTMMRGAVIYDGDTIEARTLENIDFFSKMNAAQRERFRAYDRLRNAVYVTYPYARRAGAVMNEINIKLIHEEDKENRKKYIKSREKELKKEFTDPLSNLSVYQGKVLMKLINRQTGNNCYEIIKELRGAATARFYQTIAFFFSSNLKQTYNASGSDRVIEGFVQEVMRMYGYDDIRSTSYIN